MTREEKEQWDIFMELWVNPALKNTWGEKKYKEIVEALEEWEEQEPCEDAISREDALMCLTGEIKDTDTIETIIARSGRRIRKLPPVTPQPKTGHWIDIMVGDMPAQACDQCNTFYPLAYTGGGHKYCPNCGCRMVEPQERSE